MRLALSIITILIMTHCYAQTEHLNRKPFTLKLAVDSVNYYEQEIKESPYFVSDEVLQIYPGEKLFVETNVLDSSILSMKVVPANKNPERTIEIEFSQDTEGRNNKMMILKVKNPFGLKLHYSALMYIVGSDKWIKTSTFPVQPELLGYETWNDVIITLVLSDWKLNNED